MNDENELEIEETRRRLVFEWVLPTLYAPRRTLKNIVEQTGPVWLAPLLVLSVLALLAALCGGPVRTRSAQMNVSVPTDMQYYTPEQQEQMMAAQQNTASPLFAYVFPGLAALAGVWAGWFLLGGLMHLALTLAGSRSSSTQSMNLAAFASLPFGIRFLVQGIYTLASSSLITASGVSGFIAADAEGAKAFFRILLGFVDIYLLWQIVLLLGGSLTMTGLSRRKAWAALLLVLAIVLCLSALPGWLLSKLSGIGSVQTFIPF